jgi:hypothetical protein
VLVSFENIWLAEKRAIVPAIEAPNDRPMDDAQYLSHCQALLEGFAATLRQRTEFLPPDDGLRELSNAFSALAAGQRDLYVEGPALVERLFTTYPDFAPTFPRDLLWFLGSDCLHFMADSEIELYQALDAQRHEAAARGERLDLAAARAKLLKLQ